MVLFQKTYGRNFLKNSFEVSNQRSLNLQILYVLWYWIINGTYYCTKQDQISRNKTYFCKIISYFHCKYAYMCKAFIHNQTEKKLSVLTTFCWIYGCKKETQCRSSRVVVVTRNAALLGKTYWNLTDTLLHSWQYLTSCYLLYVQ